MYRICSFGGQVAASGGAPDSQSGIGTAFGAAGASRVPADLFSAVVLAHSADAAGVGVQPAGGGRKQRANLAQRLDDFGLADWHRVFKYHAAPLVQDRPSKQRCV